MGRVTSLVVPLFFLLNEYIYVDLFSALARRAISLQMEASRDYRRLWAFPMDSIYRSACRTLFILFIEQKNGSIQSLVPLFWISDLCTRFSAHTLLWEIRMTGIDRGYLASMWWLFFLQCHVCTENVIVYGEIVVSLFQ